MGLAHTATPIMVVLPAMITVVPLSAMIALPTMVVLPNSNRSCASAFERDKYPHEIAI